jgi:hypothetical protein
MNWDRHPYQPGAMALALSSGAIFMPQKKCVSKLFAVYDRNLLFLTQFRS